MAISYFKNSNSLIKQILGIIKDKNVKNYELIEEFGRQFFRFTSPEELKDYSAEELALITIKAFNNYYNFSGETKLSIFNCGKDRTEYTIIETINIDIPFLVDSLTEEIKRQGYDIKYFTHPVIAAQRNNKGDLTGLKNSNKQALPESFIQFHLFHQLDEVQRANLQTGLEEVLTHVKTAVNAWQPILSKAGDVIKYYEKIKLNLEDKDEDAKEIVTFIRWLCNNNFIFLGALEEDYINNKVASAKKDKFGIFTLQDIWLPNYQSKISDIAKLLDSVQITKSNEKSLIHRYAHMDIITFLKLDENLKPVGAYHFCGMFTSGVYYQTAKDIPIIHRKIDIIKHESGFSSSGHSGKALAAILEDFPRDELFQISTGQLFEIAMEIVALTTTPRLKLFIRKDDSERFVSCLIFLPKERMSTELRIQIEEILAATLGGRISNHYTQVAESSLARLQIIVKTVPGQIPVFNRKKLEDSLDKISRNWNEYFHETLTLRLGQNKGNVVFNNYKKAFLPGYTNHSSAEDAFYDVKKINNVIESNLVRFDLYRSSEETDKDVYYFKVYSPHEQVSLSKIMPMLENMGLYALDENTYLVSPAHSLLNIWIHQFRIKFKINAEIDFKDVKRNFEEAIELLWDDKIENDSLNELIISANLNWRKIVLLRVYVKYLQQINFVYAQSYVQEALSFHPGIVSNLIDLFEFKFAPQHIENREKSCKKTLNKIDQALTTVSNLSEDKVIKALRELIENTWRSNYYQLDIHNNFKEYISIKLNSKAISFLPKPKPFTEIFVYSVKVSGIHLRGGKVARGGLRWSDRREDFRTEILGLMKAQMTKNTVIIPVGSKGGFVVKKVPKEGGREALLNVGIECYKEFLSGLLDITDNIKGDKIIKPANVICYDEDDPYLVVAADKGTATFSDIANSVSAEYEFWLQDAFASGGSVGYDHKKMGITAKGAWISVQNHFRTLDIDVQTQPFTVIGIGDMAGDVFGNGMLLSEQIKLVAAFNHMHIFLDPDPAPAPSFKERKRLFELPRSTWADYDKNLISKGGGIFERSAKSIKLNTQIKNLLDIKEDELSPDELIKAILKAPADLLWNGGIGTYVKSNMEDNNAAGDKSNDFVRINGSELRVKVVGEGGNLGFTQLGRIEYSFNGGLINTDFIDNSAGVDCSDHEVNIKIALNDAISKTQLNLVERNKLLSKMTGEVEELVLRDNYLQTQFITTAQVQSKELLEGHARAIESLEKNGLLDRALEFLPTKEEIAKRHIEGKGLTRPEISVLTAYSKLSLYDELIDSDLPDDEYFKADLEFYFPRELREKFIERIHNHQLKREIIANCITNSLINRMGIEVYQALKEGTAMETCNVAKAYTVVRDVFEFRDVWSLLDSYSSRIQVKDQVELLLEIRKLIERIIFWLLKHFNKFDNLTEIVAFFRPGIKELITTIPDVLYHQGKKSYMQALKCYKDNKIPDEPAKIITSFKSMHAAFNIVQAANNTNNEVRFTALIYYRLGEELQFDWLKHQLEKLNTNSYWQKTSTKTLVDEIYYQQQRLTEYIIQKALEENRKANKDILEIWLQYHSKQISRYLQFIAEITSNEEFDFSMVLVAISKVKEIAAH